MLDRLVFAIEDEDATGLPYIVRYAAKEYTEQMHKDSELWSRINRAHKEDRTEFILGIAYDNALMVRDIPRDIYDLVRRVSEQETRKEIAEMFLHALELQGNSEDAAILVEDYIASEDVHILEEIVQDYDEGRGIH